MPSELGHVLVSCVLYVVFVKVRNANIRLKEGLVFVFIASAISMVLQYPIVENAIFGIVVNTSYVVIMAIIANVKTKILQLSIVYALLANVIVLWSAILSSLTFDIISIVILDIDILRRYVIEGSASLTAIYVGLTLVYGFFISRKTGKVFHKKIAHFDRDIKKRLANYLLISGLATLALFFTSIFLTEIMYLMELYALVYATILTVGFGSMAFAIFAFSDSLQKDTELKHNVELMQDLEKYTKHVEAMSSELRGFRHDHINLMITFKSHIDSGDTNALRHHYDTYMSEFISAAESAEKFVDRLKNILTAEFKTSLFIKFSQAHSKNIKTTIEVDGIVTVKKEKNLLDICRISGILMDNAIEACEGVENSEINFFCGMQNGNLQLVFQNTCHQQVPLNLVSKEGYSTKGEGRGLGLYNVSRMIQKNNNLLMQTKCSNNKFTQEVMITS